MKLNGQTSGGTVVLKHDNSRGTDDRYFGPGHFGLYSENGVDYVTFHYYDPNGFYPNPAVNNQGGPTLGLAKLVWDEDGWPSVSMDFVEKGVYTVENGFSKKVVDVSSQTLVNGASLFQYAADTTYQTQKWVFNTLGSGEYSISNYASPEMFVEAGGTNEDALSVTSEYIGTVNQRFRTVTSPNGKSIIYPSTKDIGWGISLPTGSDVKISLRSVTNQDYLRWNMIPFDETLFVSETKLTIEQTAGTNNDIIVESNGLWSTSVLYDTWLNVESAGMGNDTLRISFSENSGANDRKNRIYITSNGGISKIINITQPGKPTATADLSDNDYFEIFPNPASHEIFIKSGKIGKLSVYNQTGQKICDFNLVTGKNRLNISDYKNGIYLLKLVSDNKTIVKKFIKN